MCALARGPRLPGGMKLEERYYATGRRKTAVARVWVTQGSGQIKVNNHTVEEYFGEAVRNQALMPLTSLGVDGQFDVWCTVKGGGITGQAGALRHGLARALAHPQAADDPLVFVASLNEWSEGHYLEPDERFGSGWLEAVRAARGPRSTMNQFHGNRYIRKRNGRNRWVAKMMSSSPWRIRM